MVYAGTDADGFAKTFVVETSGVIGAVLDTLEYDTFQGKLPHAVLTPLSTAIFVVAYQGADGDGFVASVGFTILTEGTMWVETTNMHYIDETGIERIVKYEGESKVF